MPGVFKLTVQTIYNGLCIEMVTGNRFDCLLWYDFYKAIMDEKLGRFIDCGVCGWIDAFLGVICVMVICGDMVL